MDRENAITLLKEIIFNNSLESSIKLLENYCIEKGKDMKYFDAFVKTLIISGNINTCLSIAIGFYRVKYTIYNLYNKQNQLIHIY